MLEVLRVTTDKLKGWNQVREAPFFGSEGLFERFLLTEGAQVPPHAGELSSAGM